VASSGANGASSPAEPLILDDFTNIKNLFSTDPDSPRMVYAVLKIASLGEGSFNRITQTYTAQLTDSFENRLKLAVPYSKINETAILNLEYLERSGIVPDAVTVNIALPDEGFGAAVFPIALWINGEIKNSGEENLFADDKKSDYEKFFKLA
jgi:hypothetical protein